MTENCPISIFSMHIQSSTTEYNKYLLTEKVLTIG